MRSIRAARYQSAMPAFENPNWFANSPIARLNNEKALDEEVAERLGDPTSLLIPLWRGDPLVTGGAAGFLSAAARSEFPADCPIVLLGERGGVSIFAIDISDAAASAETAPFADIGAYIPIREAAGVISKDDLATVGHGRWLFEWHRKHRFCANCGAQTNIRNGGAKRRCDTCETEHFPRTDPVAIVVAIHEGACLLGRGPHFPPGFLSALAGFIEAAETPEEAAKRELFEEAGVTLTNIRYQFSQPWPFPSSMMMGFLAETTSRDLTLDKDEIVEARWIDKADIRAAIAGEERDFRLPPNFTIARQLLERWVSQS